MTETYMTQPVLGEQVSYKRLLWIGPLTIMAATIANFIVWQLALVLLQPDPAFVPLSPPVPLVLTILAVAGAVIAFAIVGRLSRNPIPVFKRVAILALILSFIPDLALLVTRSDRATSLENVLALMLMHVVAYVISVYLLTNFAREASSS